MALRPELAAICLCDGYGGFELGLREHGIRTVCRVERDSYAAAVLVARMEEQRLDMAPVWDDLATFDGAAWRGRVDLITAGFPCQPFSAAGRRKGVDDDRWLWPAIRRIIRDVAPGYVCLENVPGLVRAGLPHVLADLADLGFDAEWGLLSAADVGATHKRQRFWLVAALADDDNDGRLRIGRQPQHDGDALDDADRSSGTNVADTYAGRRIASVGNDDQRQGKSDTTRIGTNVADAASARRDKRGRQAVKSPEIGRRGSIGSGFPPRPDDTDAWQQWVAQGRPEPSVRRSADGRPVGLADALHLGGNGLVPATASEAWRQLSARLAQQRVPSIEEAS